MCIRDRAALTLGAAWIALAGAFEVLLALCVWCALAFGFTAPRKPLRANARLAARIGLCALLATGLAAAQLLPSFELLARSSRNSGLAAPTASLWSLPPARWIELLAPGFFGNPARRTSWATAFAPHPLGVPYLGGIFIGVPPLALAVAALRGGDAAHRQPRRRAWLLLAIALTTLVLAAGPALPAFALARRWIPGVRLFRYPEKFLTLGTVAIALLAACGLERCRRDERAAWRAATSSATISFALLLACALGWALARCPVEAWLAPRLEAAALRTGPHTAWRLGMTALVKGAGLAALSSALLHAGHPSRGVAVRRRLWRIGFTLLLALGPLLCNRALIEVRARRALLTRPAGLPPPEAFETAIGRFRLATEDRLFEPHHASLLGYRCATSYGAVALADEQRFDALLRDRPRLRLRLASVRYVYGRQSGGDRRPVVIELPDALPRATLVPLAVRARDERTLTALLRRPHWEPRLEVVLGPQPYAGHYPDARLPEGGVGPPQRWQPPRIRLLEERPEHIAWSISTPSGGWFVVTDSLYPGWRTTIDGHAAPTERANLRFRAVRVEAGTHIVAMTLHSPSARTGALISLATALLLGILGAVNGYGRGKRGRGAAHTRPPDRATAPAS